MQASSGGPFRRRPPIDVLNAQREGCAVGHLGIELTELGPDFLRGRMPVDARTKQPYGLLHGGSSALLAETLASIAATAAIGTETAPSLRRVPAGFPQDSPRIPLGFP